MIFSKCAYCISPPLLSMGRGLVTYRLSTGLDNGSTEILIDDNLLHVNLNKASESVVLETYETVPMTLGWSGPGRGSVHGAGHLWGLVQGEGLCVVLVTCEVWSRERVCVWCWSPVRSGPGSWSGAGHLWGLVQGGDLCMVMVRGRQSLWGAGACRCVPESSTGFLWDASGQPWLHLSQSPDRPWKIRVFFNSIFNSGR